MVVICSDICNTCIISYLLVVVPPEFSEPAPASRPVIRDNDDDEYYY